MLTFATYFILKNPETYRKLREEIDTMVGDRSMTAHDVGKLPYLLGEFSLLRALPQNGAAFSTHLLVVVV